MVTWDEFEYLARTNPPFAEHAFIAKGLYAPISAAFDNDDGQGIVDQVGYEIEDIFRTAFKDAPEDSMAYLDCSSLILRRYTVWIYAPRQEFFCWSKWQDEPPSALRKARAGDLRTHQYHPRQYFEEGRDRIIWGRLP